MVLVKIHFLIIQIAKYEIGLLKNKILAAMDLKKEFLKFYIKKEKATSQLIQLKEKMEY